MKIGDMVNLKLDGRKGQIVDIIYPILGGKVYEIRYISKSGSYELGRFLSFEINLVEKEHE